MAGVPSDHPPHTHTLQHVYMYNHTFERIHTTDTRGFLLSVGGASLLLEMRGPVGQLFSK